MLKPVALLALALVATLLFLSSTPASAGEAGQANATVSVSPAAQTVAAGDTVSIQLQVANVTDPDGLAAYEFGILFDPQVLSFDSFTNGDFLESTGREGVCLPPLFDLDGDTTPDPGYVRVACVTFGATPPAPTGGGLLATFTFDALCAGSGDFEFERGSLSDPLGGGIPFTSTEGSVTITGKDCSPPTPAGDANCDGLVNSIDAALILQLGAGLLVSLPCDEAANVNGDLVINSIDAALVLQFSAGLLDSLPV